MKYLFLIVTVMIVVACTDRRATIIAEKVAERVEKERQKKLAECRLQLLEKAATAVDSILLSEARQSLLDSLALARPLRPLPPNPLPVLDSGRIEPIFK